MIRILLSMVGAALLFNHSISQTTIPAGEIYGNWTKDNSPYQIQGDVVIPNDSTLFIEPGVKVEFMGYYALNVQGRLLATGNETDSIWFTAADTTGFHLTETVSGGWNGIQFIDTPSGNDTSIINYCKIQYGKAVGSDLPDKSGGALYISNFDKVLVSNCSIKNNSAGGSDSPSGGGICLQSADIILENNDIFNNRAWDGGGIQIWESNCIFKRNRIVNNTADAGGGGIWIGGVSDTEFHGDQISGNVAGSGGGGINCWQGTVTTLHEVSVENNKAKYGGGLHIIECELFADSCHFLGNQGSDSGGGAFEVNDAYVTINNSQFEANKAAVGGGIHAAFSKLYCENTDFFYNIGDHGGGMFIENSNCKLQKCLFDKNQAVNGNGGAINCNADSLIFDCCYQFELKNCILRENKASGNCAALRIEQDQNINFPMLNVDIESCQFIDNYSDVYGSMRLAGAVDNFLIANSIFAHNRCNRHTSGPGFIALAKGIVINSVFNSNYSLYTDSTKTYQGASVSTGAEVDFINCTFTDTSSSEGIGISFRRGAKSNILNSILYNCGNRPINLVTLNDLGCVANVFYSNIEYGQDSVYLSDELSIVKWGEGNIAKDPLFVDPLSGNFYLQDSSPCIGAGQNQVMLEQNILIAPESDIEGMPRPGPVGSNPDLGAYENQLGNPLETGLNFNLTSNSYFIQNYPNPFHTITTFRYHIAHDCYAEIHIHNIKGKRICTIVSERKRAGLHHLEWNAEELRGGQYLYKLVTNNGYSSAGLMTITK